MNYDLTELKASKELFENAAGNYTEKTKQELADMYCDATDKGDESTRNKCYSALLLKYWYVIFKRMDDSASLKLSAEDFVSWVMEALDYTLEHRQWRDATKKVYKDPDGFDKCVNMAHTSVRLIHYQAANRSIRKGNFNSVSLDALTEEMGDAGNRYVDAFVEEDRKEGIIECLINNYLKRNADIEALIIDAISYQDTFKEAKKTKTASITNDEGELEKVEINYSQEELNERKLVKHLTQIDEEFMTNYFCPTYGVSYEKAQDILNKLKATSNTKLYRSIKYVLTSLKTNPLILSYKE